MGIFPKAVGDLVYGIILISQSRVHHEPHLYAGHLVALSRDGIADGNHAVLGCTFIQKGQPLLSSNLLHAPGSNQRLPFLRKRHFPAFNSLIAVISSKNIILYTAVLPGHAERSIGSVEILGRINQKLVVI